ncbi:MAG TPA: hypothetical protein PKD77_09765 [Rudaea sp.]|jgi:hypothetical protein|nr:hypothetical protein [Rudaea sp.]
MNDSSMTTELATCEARVRLAEENIAWILDHPAFSGWLKDTLGSAIARDPERVANDLEILTHVLRGWTSARIDRDLLQPRDPGGKACANCGSGG